MVMAVAASTPINQMLDVVLMVLITQMQMMKLAH